jgi:lysophospholipase L1-like esterase
MYYSYNDPSIRYTGRFALYEGAMTTTACGSQILIAFQGDHIVLNFDTKGNERNMPHLWLRLDGGIKVETAVDEYLRVEADAGEHVLEIIFKSAVEMQPRFFHPLVGKISFKGYDAQNAGVLPADNRKTIELVGDSITEGVLIDVECGEAMEDRPYQDDSTATYAWLTTENLGLRHYHMGYGAVGTTKSGCGAVPKAAEAYPYCFEDAPIDYHPDYVLINHGTNDRGHKDMFREEYEGLLDVIRSHHPDAKIICLSPFCGAFAEELEELVADYNREKGTDVVFINGGNWIEPDPIHPLRPGHKIVAKHLTEILSGIIG